MDYEMDDMEFYEQRMLVEDWMYDEDDPWVNTMDEWDDDDFI